MSKPITLSGIDFESFEQAKQYIKNGVSTGDHIQSDSKFSVLKELFSEYSNGDPDPLWHIDPESICRFEFGPKLNGDAKGKRLMQNNCFWCVFSNGERRNFSVPSALKAVFAIRNKVSNT